MSTEAVRHALLWRRLRSNRGNERAVVEQVAKNLGGGRLIGVALDERPVREGLDHFVALAVEGSAVLEDTINANDRPRPQRAGSVLFMGTPRPGCQVGSDSRGVPVA